MSGDQVGTPVAEHGKPLWNGGGIAARLEDQIGTHAAVRGGDRRCVEETAYSDIRVQVNISPDFACKVLSEKHKRLVSDTIKHYYDDNGKYQFDTLQLYQLAAESIGYSIHKLTHLRGYISMNMDRYFSNDIIHIGASSHFLDVSN